MADVIRVLAAALTAATGLGGTYDGTAGQLVPTAGQAHYAQRLSSTPVKHASGTVAPGFKSGWIAIFRKGSAKAPVTTGLTVSVYTSSAAAASAYRQLCHECGSTQKALTMSLKFGRHGSGIEAVAVCNNIVTAALTDGHEAETTLAHDAGFAAGFPIGRAWALGMARCRA